MRYPKPKNPSTGSALLAMLLILGLLAGIESPSGATDPPPTLELTAEAFMNEVAAAADACNQSVGKHDTTMTVGDRTYLVQ